MKVLVVGGISGGMSAAARLRRLTNEAEIIVFERGPRVAFSNCALPFHISEEVKDADDLILDTSEGLSKKFDLDIRTNEEVVALDREAKIVTVKSADRTYEESYDKLVLAPGARANNFSIEGEETIKTRNLRTVEDASFVHDIVRKPGVDHVLVLGAGFIGLEAVEALVKAGLRVSLVEYEDQVLNTLDYNLAQILHKELVDRGVDLRLGVSLEKIEDGKAILSDGAEIPVDFMLRSTGLIPNTEFIREAGIETDERGYIKVDKSYLTNDRDIYAVGDATLSYFKMSDSFAPLQLAGPSQMAARKVADHIMGNTRPNKGVLGASSLRLFDYNIAYVGRGADELKKSHKDNYDYSLVIPKDRLGLMEGSADIFLKLVFEKPTGRILGAQAVSKGEAVKRIDVIGTAMNFGATLYDLVDLELSYSPTFSTAKDPVNMAAMVGVNILEGAMDQVHLEDVRDLVKSGAYILDVRGEGEYKNGHIKGSVNIPLPEIRDRMDEIPKDRDIYVHCRSSQRSYYALTALRNAGFDRVKNIQGSFLGISFYEYFDDKRKDRDPIVTAYNFK